MSVQARILLIYLIGLGVIGLLAGLSMAPGFGSVFVMLTFGIGAVLLPVAPNLFVWMALALPMVLLLPLRRLWPIGLGAAVSVWLGWTVLVQPALLAEREVEAMLAQLTAGDLVRPLEGAPLVGVELDLSDRGQSSAQCSPLCRALLEGDHAEWVRVVGRGAGEGEGLRRHYRMAGGVACEGEALCVQQVTGDYGRADLAIARAPAEAFDRLSGQLTERVTRLRDARHLLVTDRRSETLLFRETAVTYRQATLPLAWVPEFQEIHMKGFTVLKPLHETPRRSPAEALARIGLPVVLAPKVLPRQRTREDRLPTSVDVSAAIAVLDQPGEAPSAPADQQVLSRYVHAARWFPDNELPDLHRALALRIMQDVRLDTPVNFDHLLLDDAGFRAMVLPWTMAALAPGSPYSVYVRSNLRSALRNAWTPEELAPAFDAYTQLLAALPDDANTAYFWPMGRFGHDPSALIERYGAGGKRGLWIAKGAFCYGAPEWDATLAAALWDAWAAEVRSGARLDAELMEESMTALVWAGYLDEVNTLLGELDEVPERLARFIERVRHDRPKLQAC